MNVVFVYREAESLAVQYLSAVLKQHGHETDLVFDMDRLDSEFLQIRNRFDSESLPGRLLGRLLSSRQERAQKIAERVLVRGPDLVAFSVVTDYYQWFCLVAQEIKKMASVPIVFGGIHPTSLPEKVMSKDFVDYVVVGEGEYALLDLANSLSSGGSVETIQNLWSKRDGTVVRNTIRPAVEDLDSLPFPDKDIFYRSVPHFSEMYCIMTSRGCPFACTYCWNSFFHRLYKGRGRFLRRRSVQNVIDELVWAKEQYDYRMVFFLDDNFTSDKKWLREFLTEYTRKVGVIFRCIVHPSFIDEEVAHLLKEAGCKRTQVGVQTVNEELKRTVLHRHETNEQIAEMARCIKGEGIYLEVDHIFGLPFDKPSDYLDAARFYSAIEVDHVLCFWFRYYPKTEIVELARQANLIGDADVEKYEEGLGGDYFRGGDVSHSKELTPFEALFAALPFMPKTLAEKFIDKGLYRYLPRSYFLFLTIPRLVHMVTLMSSQQDYWIHFKRKVLTFFNRPEKLLK